MALSPSDIVIEIYNKLKEIAKTSETPVKSLVISLLVYAAKQFSKANVFSCPIENHYVYGSLFIYGPAVVLLCLSLLISESFWHLTTGLFVCGRIIWWKSRKSIYLAILPPFVWLILVFADAHYFVCAELGPIESAKAAANSSDALEAVKIKFSNARSKSQIISWILLLSLMGIATLALTVDRCCSRLQSKIIRKDDFEDMEADYAMKLFNERIKPLAKTQAKASVDHFFDIYKDEKPDEVVKLAEDYLLAVYPNYGGGHVACCGAMHVENKSLKIKELFKKRNKNVEEVEVGLTESGPQAHYTSIN